MRATSARTPQPKDAVKTKCFAQSSCGLFKKNKIFCPKQLFTRGFIRHTGGDIIQNFSGEMRGRNYFDKTKHE